MAETLNGLIDRVTYHNPENGFAVLRVKVKGQREPVPVVGRATAVAAGQYVEATGRWVIDRQHGRQFAADELRLSHPASAEGIEKYLASGAIRSIGPTLAARIVSVYKERTLDVFENYADMLLHIKGIGAERLRRIRQSWQEQKEVRKIMLFLAEHGITAARAVRIYRTYGQQAIQRIKENPYRLAEDIRGIGFRTADQLAANLGIARDSPDRARAAVQHALRELAAQGHCGFPQTGVVQHAVKLVGIEQLAVEQAVEQAVQDGVIVCQLVRGEPWLYLDALYRAEVGLARSILRIATAAPHPLPPIDVEKALAWVEQRLGMQLAEAQQEAVRQACRHKMVVVTGGPGVGKTTLVRSLLEIFAAKKLRCVLAAPTGRAAKRLAELTGHPAKTIHRLLELDPSTGRFKRDQQRPLEGELFVLDEVSMVDVMLGHQLLRAIPETAAVVLVGDVDQLPSVGPGMVLADLIASQVVPVVRLTEVFRQAGRSRIVAAAHAINRGEMPPLAAPDQLADFYFVECDEPEAIQDAVLRLVQQRIAQRFGLQPRRDIQVLTPMHRSLLGARNLNQVLQEALNPPGPAEVQRYGWTFRVGDRVIQTENNYDRDVFNGDLGVVADVNRVEQIVTVQFDRRAVEYDFSELDELSLAYVLSIHKSQGSEFPAVVIPLHTQHYLMLQRNLLYTAVTRGKQLVVIVGSRKALAMAVRRKDTTQRCTALKTRLQQLAASPSCQPEERP